MKRRRPACPSRIVRFKRRDTRAIRYLASPSSSAHSLFSSFPSCPFSYFSLLLFSRFSLPRKIDSVQNYSLRFSLSLFLSFFLSFSFRPSSSLPHVVLSLREIDCGLGTKLPGGIVYATVIDAPTPNASHAGPRYCDALSSSGRGRKVQRFCLGSWRFREIGYR